MKKKKCSVCGATSVETIEADFIPEYYGTFSGDKYRFFECTNGKCKHVDKEIIN